MREHGIRCRVDDRNEKIGYKIRESETNKIPYMGIVGDQEAESETVAVRKRREGDLGKKKIAEFIQELSAEIERRD
jgi:threonyl-tRNA synthetase